MARRSFNGKKIFNEAWDNNTKLALFWLISNADGFGLQRKSPGQLADILQISKRASAECIEILIEQKVLIEYSDNGQSYLAFRKWQDYQKLRYAGMPSCPFPSMDIYEQLSSKTQFYLLENSENFYNNISANSGAKTYSNSNSNSNNSGKEGGVGETGCGWCLHPKENEQPDYNLILFHHQQFKQRKGFCPDSSKAVSRFRKAFQRLLKTHSEQEIQDVIVHALDCPAEWVKDLSGIENHFDKILLTMKKGEIYGEARGGRQEFGAKPARQNPSDPSRFQKSGRASFDDD